MLADPEIDDTVGTQRLQGADRLAVVAELAVVVVVEDVTVGALGPLDDRGAPRRMQRHPVRVVVGGGEEHGGHVEVVELGHHRAVLVETDWGR